MEKYKTIIYETRACSRSRIDEGPRLRLETGQAHMGRRGICSASRSASTALTAIGVLSKLSMH